VRAREILFLFAIGAAGGLVGDAGNVQAGVTQYGPNDLGPATDIWNSRWWFPVLVGLGTVSVGVMRLRLGEVRAHRDPRIAIGAIAAVMAIYAVSSAAFDSPNDSIAKVALCAAIAALLASMIADRPGVTCGLLAAAAGPLVEVAIVHCDLSSYDRFNDGYFGVALWLPPLYFAFGVTVARITELIVARRTLAT
jgi:hypothetical protein